MSDNFSVEKGSEFVRLQYENGILIDKVNQLEAELALWKANFKLITDVPTKSFQIECKIGGKVAYYPITHKDLFKYTTNELVYMVSQVFQEGYQSSIKSAIYPLIENCRIMNTSFQKDNKELK